MNRLNTLISGLAIGLLAPAIAFAVFFKIHDPQLAFADELSRLRESQTLPYYLSLCVLINLAAFFLFLRINAERSARGVLGATIIYAFIVLLLKLA